MAGSVNHAVFVGMLQGAVEQVRAEHELLSRLDSLSGDGDHGTTMLRAVKKIETTLEETSTGSISDLLQAAGWAILGVDGGATGPLLGMLFVGMAEASEGKGELDTTALAGLLEAGLASVEKQTRAREGDKTLMDALIPAVRALREGAENGEDVSLALERACTAAEAGAEATIGMEARFGRARNLGPRSIGQPDPGATTISLIFRGFLEGAKRHAR